MDTFDRLAAEVADLTRRLDEARAAACPPFEGSGCTDRGEREDDLRALRNVLALLQFGVPRRVPLIRHRPRRPPPPAAAPSGIPYPRRPTDAT